MPRTVQEVNQSNNQYGNTTYNDDGTSSFKPGGYIGDTNYQNVTPPEAPVTGSGLYKSGVGTATPTATPIGTNQPNKATFTPEQNTGLIAAQARIKVGTPGEKDQANLDYATKNGWIPPVQNVQSQTGQTGTETPVAGTEEEKAPELDYPTKIKNISSVISSGVTDANQIAKSLNMDVNDVNDALLDPTLANAKSQVELTNTRQKQYDDMIKAQNDISNGIIKLTTDEQAQIDYATSLLEQTKADQLEANENYQKGLGVFNTVTGLAEFAPGRAMESLQKAITKGNQIIRNLDVEAIAKISELKQLFLDKKYKEVKDNYEKLDKITADKSKTIQDLYKNTVDAVNQYQDSKDKRDQQQFENILASDKFSWEQKQAFLKAEADKNKDDRDYALKLKQLDLDITKARAADTADNRAEYDLSGGASTGKSYEQFLLEKGRASDKPATADQQLTATYVSRMKAASDTISRLTPNFKEQGFFGQMYNKNAPTWALGETAQSMEQAQRDFVNAVLRKESGAAISPTEFESAIKQYFPQPGDSAEVIAQKARNRTTSIQGLANAAGSALSQEFKDSIGKTFYTSVQQAYDENPELKNTIQKMQKDNPQMTEDELLQVINAGSENFSRVGGDTDTATLQKVASIPNGEKGGQCGRFVNNLTGLGLGDSYKSKIDKMNPSITKPEPGMVFVMPYKDTGHTGIILSVNNGIATVKDSNYSLDGKVKTHQIPVSKMTGFNFA